MDGRRGQRLGWTLGWGGASLWMITLAVDLFFRGEVALGFVALGLFGVAAALVAALAPWRHPRTRWWKLILPLYALYLATLAGFLAVGAVPLSPAEARQLPILLSLPLLVPLLTAGRLRWDDSGATPDQAEAKAG